MGRLAKGIATVGGLGLSPVAPGTVGSLAGLAIATLWPGYPNPALHLSALAVVFGIGVVAASRTERDLDVLDPGCVVIDELVAMWLIGSVDPLKTILYHFASYFPFSQRAMCAAVAFAAFRFFDIVKPPPIKRLARLPGGWGIMLDDLGAALYAWLVIQILFRWIHLGHAILPAALPS